jgi:hypothetical protein
MMSKSKMKYVFRVPTAVPAERVLVHNSARHDPNTVPGTNGFRAFMNGKTVVLTGGTRNRLCTYGRHEHEDTCRNAVSRLSRSIVHSAARANDAVMSMNEKAAHPARPN